MANKTLIILDSFEYKRKECTLKDLLKDISTSTFVYTQYENCIIQFFFKLSIVGNFLFHISYWWISLVKAVGLLTKISYKNKIFINPIVAIFYCSLSRFLFIQEKITVAGFLFEAKSNKLYLNLRKIFVNFSYKKVDKIIVYSQNEVAFYSKLFPSLSNKFVFIKYGKDYDHSNKKDFEFNSPYISSGGGSNRDFITLCKAIELLKGIFPDILTLIATKPNCLSQDNMFYPNILIKYNIRLNQFGAFIDKSLFFVLPLIDTILSAGHMALLEAMSRGKIILVADIPSTRDYVDENHVIFYNPEDIDDLAKKIEYIYTNKETHALQKITKNAKNFYNTEYTFISFLRRIVIESK